MEKVIAVLIMVLVVFGEFSLAGEKASDGRFIAYDNRTVLDTRTNLMWAAQDNGAWINWMEAIRYINNYRGEGYTNWRLPTQNELMSLYDTAVKGKNGYHLTSFIELTGCCPVASQTDSGGAVCVNFTDGAWIFSHASQGECNRVLPVRSSK